MPRELIDRFEALQDAAAEALRQIQTPGSPPPGGYEVSLPFYAREARKLIDELTTELRYLFYYRVDLLGTKLEDILIEKEHERARRIFELLRRVNGG